MKKKKKGAVITGAFLLVTAISAFGSPTVRKTGDADAQKTESMQSETEAGSDVQKENNIWIERDYYQGENLVSEEKRILNETGGITQSVIHYSAGVPLGSTTTYQLDKSGRRVSGQITYENGAKADSRVEYQYDKNDRVKEIIWNSDEGVQKEQYSTMDMEMKQRFL